MSGFNIKIEFEEGEPDGPLPSRLRVQFGPMPYYFAFKTMAYFTPIPSKELKREEARRYIESFLYMLQKELEAALPEELRW